MIVYFHRNPVTLQVFYIGIGSSEKRAYSLHKSSRSLLWYRYVQKYGTPVVDIVITDLTEEQAIREEIYFIKFYGMLKDGGILYNLNEGGFTGSNLRDYLKKYPERNPMFNPEVVKKFKGENNSSKRPEVKEKLRLANIGKRANAETKAKQSLAKKNKPSNQPKGFKHTEETIRAMRIINKEIANRPDVKEKLRQFNLGRRIPSKHRPVIMINPKTEIEIKRFECVRDAGIEFNKPNTGNIASVCNGRRNLAFGYKWKYAS